MPEPALPPGREPTGSRNGLGERGNGAYRTPVANSPAGRSYLFRGEVANEASLGPPRWVAGLGGIVAVGCWLRSSPSLPSDGRGVAARLFACQNGFGQPGCRSWLRQ